LPVLGPFYGAKIAISTKNAKKLNRNLKKVNEKFGRFNFYLYLCTAKQKKMAE